MKADPGRTRKRRPIVRWLRIVTYSLLALGLIEYFLLQPAHITVDDLPPPEPALRPLVERLRGHVEFLASPELKGRAPGTPGNKQAEAYLLDQFERLGLVSPAPDGTRTQAVSPELGNNVFSALPPVKKDRDWLLVGAHFDHLGKELGQYHLGADDNASSVAILLETARRLVEQNGLHRYNLLFVGFNSEEAPYFLTRWMGSIRFYQEIEKTGIDPDTLRLAVIMDLMGGLFWEPLKDRIFVLGAEKSPALEAAIPAVSVPGLTVRRLDLSMIEKIPRTGGMIFSDYQVFRMHGIPHLFLSSGRTPDYHRPSDTAEKLNYPRMARSVHWLARFLKVADGLESGWSYHRRRQNLEQSFRTLDPILQKASQWSTRIPQTSFISLYKLKKDRQRFEAIREKIEAGRALTPSDARAMQLASIRVQCLLGKMGPCLLLPGTPTAED